MADHYIMSESCWYKLNDTEFEAKFGYKPTVPTGTDRTFGGRYEHSSFDSGSIADNGLVEPSDLTVKNPGNTSFAGLEAGSGSST